MVWRFLKFTTIHPTIAESLNGACLAFSPVGPMSLIGVSNNCIIVQRSEYMFAHPMGSEIRTLKLILLSEKNRYWRFAPKATFNDEGGWSSKQASMDGGQAELETYWQFGTGPSVGTGHCTCWSLGFCALACRILVCELPYLNLNRLK